MKIVNVRYGRTENLGNFRSAKLEIEAALDEGDDFDEAIEALRALVTEHLAREQR